MLDSLSGRRHDNCEHFASVQIPSPEAADVPPPLEALYFDFDDHKKNAILRHHQPPAGATAATRGRSDYDSDHIRVQRFTKRLVRGWVKFVPALAYLFCLALPGSCLTIFAFFFPGPCAELG